MSEALRGLGFSKAEDGQAVHLLGVFAPWRLQAYGYTLVVIYAAYFLFSGWLGLWLVHSNGVPRYQDFTTMFAAGLLAVHGNTASIYLPAKFIEAQNALAGITDAIHGAWPYPPTYFLILAPLATLPYIAAFLIWGLATLFGLVAVVYLIVRRSSAIAVILASPFTAVNFLFGQSGFLTGSLVGAALLTLDRRPVLSGVFIGCLTYKPQFGILFPLALVAAGQWRVIASATATAAFLAAVSIAVFGIGPWEALPSEFTEQAHENLVLAPLNWGFLQTVYGLVRYLGGNADLAWLAQGITTASMIVIVWCVWRSPLRYALKAATLSAGVLIATPYALPYDMAAIAIPAAFLARDQIRCGFLRGEQTTLLTLFVASFSLIAAGNQAPVGAPILFALLYLILRRRTHFRSTAAVIA